MFGQGRDALGMFFSLLGPLQVVDGDRNIALGAPKHRALLALLLLRRGEPVSAESLAEELWAGEPPATGTKAVRVYIGELRKALGAEVIVTQGVGYALPLDEHQTDLARFESLEAEGRRRLDEGDAEGAAPVLREALARWGPALAVYRDGRRRLVEELGIEPSRGLQELERAILAQDESIGLARRRLLSRRVRRRPALLVGLGGFLVVVAAATALAISLTRSGGGGISSVVQGNSLAAIDPSTGRVVAVVPVGATPAAVAVGGGAVWVLNADDQTISRVDAKTKEVRTLAIGATPTDLAAGPEGVWVGNGGKLARAQFAGSTAVALTRLDAHTGAVLANVPLPRTGSSRSNVAQNHIALAAGSVWAIAPDFSLVRIDRGRNEVSVVSRDVAAVAVAAERKGVWVLSDHGMLARIATKSNHVTA